MSARSIIRQHLLSAGCETDLERIPKERQSEVTSGTMLTWDEYLQAIVAVFVITDPIGKSIFFLLLTKDTPQKRVQSAITVCLTVAIILGGAAVIGRQLLDVLGIHLGALGFTGGLIVAMMGLEMLGTGHASRAQIERAKPEWFGMLPPLHVSKL